MKRYSPVQLSVFLPLLEAALATEESVIFAYLLGSASRGEPFQDLDVAYFANPCPDGALRQTLAMGARLESAVGAPVDLVPLEKSSNTFQHRVSQGILLICRDTALLARWKERVWGRYFDEAPRLAQHARDSLRAARMQG